MHAVSSVRFVDSIRTVVTSCRSILARERLLTMISVSHRLAPGLRGLLIARLSQEADGQTGIETQDEDARRWVETEGMTIVGVAAEKISGKVSLLKRPEAGPWLTDPARRATYDFVIASKMDRYVRARDWDIRKWAEEHNKLLIIANPGLVWPPEPGDLSTPLVWDTLVNLAVAEWEATSMRYKRMQQHLTDNKFLVGKPPYGFRVTGAECGQSPCECKNDHKILTPDPVKADPLREAVALYIGGYSGREAAAWLGLSPATLNDLFRNESLIGRRKNNAGRVVLRHEPILDMDTWNKLQAQLDRKGARKGVSRSHTTELPSDISWCPGCAGTLTRYPKIGRKRRDGVRPVRIYFRCRGTMQEPSRCRNMIPLDEFEEAIDVHMTHPDLAGGQPALQIEIVLGHSYENDIAEIERDIREVPSTLGDEEFMAEVARLRAELRRLRSLPAAPERVLPRETGLTVGEAWVRLDKAGKRAMLLASKARITATREGLVIQTGRAEGFVLPEGVDLNAPALA